MAYNYNMFKMCIFGMQTGSTTLFYHAVNDVRHRRCFVRRFSVFVCEQETPKIDEFDDFCRGAMYMWLRKNVLDFGGDSYYVRVRVRVRVRVVCAFWFFLLYSAITWSTIMAHLLDLTRLLALMLCFYVIVFISQKLISNLARLPI